MNEYTDGFPDRKTRVSRFKIAALIGIPLAAILFQVYVPRFFQFLSYLELPLLVTLYFGLMRRSPVVGVLFGAGIGLAQDADGVGDVGREGGQRLLDGLLVADIGKDFGKDR